MPSARHARRSGSWFASRPAGWFALATAISPHAAFLGGAGLLAVAVLPRPTVRDLVRTFGVIVSAAVVNGYAVAVVVTGIRTIRVTGDDLEAYATRAGPGGLVLTTASLHGFWRGYVEVPRDLLGAVGGLVVLVVVLGAVLLGLVRLTRLDPVAGAPLAFLAALGVLLGAGVHGPAGSLYRLAFAHVPLFEAMREQEKWVSLAVVGYAVGLGVSAELAVDLLHQRRRPVWARPAGSALLAAALLVPAVTAPLMLWGLAGQVQVSRYPAEWYAADRTMGTGTGAVLFLPWHGYQPFAFTGGRTVATPGEAFFRRPVLSSDAVELPARRTDSISRRTAYVDAVVSRAGEDRLGRLLQPLGVTWVVVSKDSEVATYDWVRHQEGVELVSSGTRLDLYRVEADPRLARVRRTGATTYAVDSGRPGQVLVPVEWSTGWRLGGETGEATPAGTVAFRAGPSAAIVHYAPWHVLLPASVASVLALLVLLAAGLWSHRRETLGLELLLRPPRRGTPRR